MEQRQSQTAESDVPDSEAPSRLGALLFGSALRRAPAAPDWTDRDRIVVELADVEPWHRFGGAPASAPNRPDGRVAGAGDWASRGHALGHAAGLALAAEMRAARFDAASRPLFQHRVICLGALECLDAGPALESIAFAGHQRLDRLLLFLLCSPAATPASLRRSCSVLHSLGWECRTLRSSPGPHDLPRTLRRARRMMKPGPQAFLVGAASGHSDVSAMRTDRRCAEQHPRSGSDIPRLGRLHALWTREFEMSRETRSETSATLQDSNPTPARQALLERVPAFTQAEISTRAAGGIAMQELAAALPRLLSLSADLHGPTCSRIESSCDFGPGDRHGRNVRCGVREHAMAAIAHGIATDGMFRPACATFLAFADYLRASLRRAAQDRLPVLYVLTHDSAGAGEDGPTHQPVESLAALRLIPGLDVIRPADAEETAGALAVAMDRTDGPTVVALTRQPVPVLREVPPERKREGVAHGAYIFIREAGKLERLVIASGSELQIATEAARRLGAGTRVVSMPSMERFDRQDSAYRNTVLPPECLARVSVEAGTTGIWSRYVGIDGRAVGIDRFGVSGPGPAVLAALGVTVEAVVAAFAGIRDAPKDRDPANSSTIRSGAMPTAADAGYELAPQQRPQGGYRSFDSSPRAPGPILSPETRLI